MKEKIEEREREARTRGEGNQLLDRMDGIYGMKPGLPEIIL
jgi:hypothetical protein